MAAGISAADSGPRDLEARAARHSGRHITVVGARENNLRGIDVDVPRDRIVAFTGVSGSGKSSLAFETIAAEGVREWNETFPAHLRSRLPHLNAPAIDHIDGLTPTIVIDQRSFSATTRSTVGTMTDISPWLRLLFSRCASPAIGPSTAYSFNDPSGMCLQCAGLGRTVQFDLDRVLDSSKTLNQGAIRLLGHQVGTYQWMLYANSGLVDPDKPLAQFSDREWADFLHGSGVNVEIRAQKGRGIWSTYNLAYEGLKDRIDRLYLKRDQGSLTGANRRIVADFTTEETCAACGGARLNPAVLSSHLLGRNIADFGAMEVLDLAGVLEQIDDPVGLPVARNIHRRLTRIAEMGLDYLTLDRLATSLSGGESQRLRMVRHLGSSLVGLTYVFDEPSVGLHPKDVDRLVRLLEGLRDRGNSVLVVEHDRDVILAADEVIDLGPGAGRAGGRVVFQGSVADLLMTDAPTARYLRSRLPLKAVPRRAKGSLRVHDASRHNLRGFDVLFPLHVLTVVTGVAGAGKSSLVCGELLRQHPGVVHVSQAPVGTTTRSTTATYLGVMDEIRRTFAQGNGVGMGMFSANSEGACPDCRGKGAIQTEMAFMDPVVVTCEACGGSRYSAEARRYRWNGRSILDVLRLTVDEAVELFEAPGIRRKLSTLRDVGLGYLTLGQPTHTLSGGESQRIKLASRLKARDVVYAMDEPTSGLHGSDIALLIELLDRLVDRGNTVIVVEHDPDVIRRADWVIDMGPGGGKHGGQVVFEGSVTDLLRCTSSVTAAYLRRDDGRPVRPAVDVSRD